MDALFVLIAAPIALMFAVAYATINWTN